MTYLSLEWSMLLFISGLALLGYAIIDSKNKWVGRIMAAFLSSVFFFYDAICFNGGLVEQVVGGTLVAVQPPFFGVILWMLGGVAVLYFILFLVDFVLRLKS